MELPKHTTQVGTIAANKKLYLEDYCISYMKQLGELYPDDRKQIALFGNVEKEKSVEYAFAYGAALLGRGKGRTDSLTNSQKEEAESFREEYFPDYQLLGVVIATDAVDENVYWLGNGNKAIPLDGYYIFYDQNEAMLNFMMHNQKEEREIDLDPVIIKKADMDREKREKREMAEQERKEAQERRAAQKKTGKYREKIQKADRSGRVKKAGKRSPFPVAACLLLLAIAGIYGLKTYYPVAGEQLKTYVSDLWNKTTVLTNSYLGNGEEAENDSADSETIEMVNAEDTVDEEITVVSTEVQQPTELDVIVIPEPDTLGDSSDSTGNETSSNETQSNPAGSQAPDSNQNDGQQSGVNPPESQQTGNQQETDSAESTEYLIQKGDSLLRILRAYYGDDSRLSEICDVNGIIDPNNIQVGQKILLP